MLSHLSKIFTNSLPFALRFGDYDPIQQQDLSWLRADLLIEGDILLVSAFTVEEATPATRLHPLH